jgi:exopolysaccharide production protein ExoQ
MSLRGARDRPFAARHGRRELAHWPVVCVLLLVVASDYKLRLRADTQSLSGNPDPMVLFEVAAYAGVAAFLFFRFHPTIRLKRANMLVFSAYAYVAILVVSALYSPYHALAVVRACQVVVVLALCRSIARHAGRSALHEIAHGYAVLVAGSVVFGVLVPFPRLRTQPDRFTWLYLHPVIAGQFLAIAVVVLIAYLFGRPLDSPGPRWPVSVYLLLLAVCAGGLVATQTRGAVFGAAFGVLVVVWTRWRGSRKIEVGVILIVVLAAVALIATSSIESFFERGESLQQLSTLNSRTDLWSEALALFPQHPLYGFGLTTSKGLFLDTIGLGGGHNAFMNLLIDTGAIGVTVWLVLLVVLIGSALRITPAAQELRLDRIMILAVMLSMIAESIFVEGLGAPANVACTWLFLMVAWADTATRSQRFGDQDQPPRRLVGRRVRTQ